MTTEPKPLVELIVDGIRIGNIQDLEYSRDAVLVDEGNCREYAAGNLIVCDVKLHQPAYVKERYILLEYGEEVLTTDEWYSDIEQQWYPLTGFYNSVLGKVVDGLYRRKALVLV